MLLNRLEIQKADIIRHSVNENYKESSYNLRIGNIVTHTGKIVDEIDLPPQGLVTVISEEELFIPECHLLMATVKNALSQKGVLALNIGLIDAGWQGPINSIIINFGKSNFTLHKGDIFLRITAHKYSAIPEELKDQTIRFPPDKYVSKTVSDIRGYLGEKFLSLDSTSKEIEKNVENSIWENIKRIGSLLGFISILGVAIGFIAFIVGRVTDTREINNRLIKMETEKTSLAKQLDNIEKKIDARPLDSFGRHSDNKQNKHK